MRFRSILCLIGLLLGATSTGAQTKSKPNLDFNGDILPANAVVRMGTSRFQAPGHAHAAGMSPDGKLIAVATYGAEPGNEFEHLFAGLPGTSLKVAVHIFDSATGRPQRILGLTDNVGNQVHFTPDGKSIVSLNWEGITVTDRTTGTKTAIGKANLRESAIALSADGAWLAGQPAAYVYDAPVGIWDMKTGKQIAKLPGRGASSRRLQFSRDGKHLLLCSVIPSSATGDSIGYDRSSKVALACIDIKAEKIVGEAKVEPTQSIALCPDGETVAFEAADNKSIRVRHLPSGADRCVLPVKLAKSAFSADGKRIVTVDGEGTATIWDAADGKKIRDLDGAIANKDFRFIGVSTDARTIAVLDGGYESTATVVVWDGATGKRAAKPFSHDSAVTCMAYSPDGKTLVSGSRDATVRLWKAATGAPIRVIAEHSAPVTAVAFSADGKLVASSSTAGVIRISSVADGKTLRSGDGPEKGASALAFSPDGKTLFAGGRSPEIQMWDVHGAKVPATMKAGEAGRVMALGLGGAVALTIDGDFDEYGTRSKDRLRLWDPIRKTRMASMPIADEKASAVMCEAAVLSTDNRIVASSQVSMYQGIRPSYGAAKLQLWERASGQPIRLLSPTITSVVAFSRDGRYLASGGMGVSGHLRVGYGAGIDIWDTVTGTKVGALKVSPALVAFSADGKHLATAGRDNDIVVWDLPKPPPAKTEKAPTADQRGTWWPVLAKDARQAYAAIGQMLDAPEFAVDSLKQQMKPVPAVDADTVNKLIAKLDSGNFAERVKAQQALEKLGDGAAHHVLKAMESVKLLETHRRLEDVLSKLDATSDSTLQNHRAVAALEWIGTPSARAVLRTLGNGAPSARVTLEANAALKRLEP